MSVNEVLTDLLCSGITALLGVFVAPPTSRVMALRRYMVAHLICMASQDGLAVSVSQDLYLHQMFLHNEGFSPVYFIC